MRRNESAWSSATVCIPALTGAYRMGGSISDVLQAIPARHVDERLTCASGIPAKSAGHSASLGVHLGQNNRLLFGSRCRSRGCPALQPGPQRSCCAKVAAPAGLGWIACAATCDHEACLHPVSDVPWHAAAASSFNNTIRIADKIMQASASH